MRKVIEAHQSGKAVTPSATRLEYADISKPAKRLYREFFRIADRAVTAMHSDLPNIRALQESIRDFSASTDKLKEIEAALTARHKEAEGWRSEWEEINAAFKTMLGKLGERERELQAETQEVRSIAESLKGYFETVKAQNDALLNGAPETPSNRDTLDELMTMLKTLKGDNGRS